MKTIISKRRIMFLSVLVIGLANLVLFLGCQKKYLVQSSSESPSIHGGKIASPIIDQKYDKDIYFRNIALDETFDEVVSIDSSKAAQHSELFYPVTVKEKLISEKKITLYRKGKSQSIATESRFMNPNITIDCAKSQVLRIARSRNLSKKIIDSLIVDHTEKRLITCLGPKTINIVMLNSELDKLNK